ncbi:hypothetical protein [Yersinia intermedia]|nr:hypothetical protein [Yersinia intermedia]EEQ20762.1 hypothetical protein yinte0001_27870 [Yersinia intermedia ATCC 29909]MCB5297442.1 hypothetical protein [Yersinia intermedia]MCB5312364.1 hypothetical protein [Yersinia intermedia]MCB5321384.1 hypothetical protein [Yersinia intermedia]MCB5326254.1 hypothetical protein [Yersinia intermedia]
MVENSSPLVVTDVPDSAMFGLPKKRGEWLATLFCLAITVIFLKIYLY